MSDEEVTLRMALIAAPATVLADVMGLTEVSALLLQLDHLTALQPELQTTKGSAA